MGQVTREMGGRQVFAPRPRGPAEEAPLPGEGRGARRGAVRLAPRPDRRAYEAAAAPAREATWKRAAGKRRGAGCETVAKAPPKRNEGSWKGRIERLRNCRAAENKAPATMA